MKTRIISALAGVSIALISGCGGSPSPGGGPVTATSGAAEDSPGGLGGKYVLYGESQGDTSALPFVTLKSGGKVEVGNMGQQLAGDYVVEGVAVKLTLPGENRNFVDDGHGCLLGGMVGSFCKGAAKPRASAQDQGDLSSGSVTMGAPTPAVVNTISGSFYTKDGDTQLSFSADGRISIIKWAGNAMQTTIGRYDVDGTKITITTAGAPIVLERKDNKFEQTENGGVTVYAAG